MLGSFYRPKYIVEIIFEEIYLPIAKMSANDVAINSSKRYDLITSASQCFQLILSFLNSILCDCFTIYLKFCAQYTSYSCINLSDKITVYDSKTASDKTSIIDVYCSEKMNKKITSSGPNLLIEFESSSNRTSNGFSAKYRFTDSQGRIYFVTHLLYCTTLPIYLYVAIVIN